MKPKLSPIATALCLILASSATAEPLQDILRYALKNDPIILEAYANEQVAQSSVKQSRAGHYPTVSVASTQTLVQHSSNDKDRNKHAFNPAINANLNLYAWGGIQAEVRQNQYKAEYFHHKTTETQEELGKTIGEFYLRALRAKELMVAAQSNIERHKRIVSDLSIIAQHDKGRQSELDQAKDRQLRAQAYLIEQQHQLESNLSRLGKYTGNMLSPNDLEDPFSGETPASLVQRYRNPDLATLPSYLAQQAEKQSVMEEVNVVKATRYPRINLVGRADRNTRQVYLNLDWDLYNSAAKHNVERTAHTLTVAETKMNQILRDVAERSRNAQIDMAQYLRRHQLAQQQIASQKRVIKAYELQFKIARRTLIDVLDSYADLSNIEINAINSLNDYRFAALEYLASQAAIGTWSGSHTAAGNPRIIADKPDILSTETLPEPPTAPFRQPESTSATQIQSTAQTTQPEKTQPESKNASKTNAIAKTKPATANQQPENIQQTVPAVTEKTQPENKNANKTNAVAKTKPVTENQQPENIPQTAPAVTEKTQPESPAPAVQVLQPIQTSVAVPEQVFAMSAPETLSKQPEKPAAETGKIPSEQVLMPIAASANHEHDWPDNIAPNGFND